MAISNFNDLIASFNYAQMRAPTKYGALTSAVVGLWNSSWLMSGSYLAPIPPAGSGSACDGSTIGRVPFADATAGRSLYLTRFMFSPSQALGAYLMDRQWHCSGLSGTVLTAQPISSSQLPIRGGNGDGNEMWLEIYVALGATGRTLTVTYTNSSDAAGRSAVVVIPAAAKQTMGIRIPLQVGDTGVKSVQSAILSGTTGTNGNFGIVLAKRITTIAGVVAGGMSVASGLDTGLPKIENNSCLYFITNSPATTSPNYDTEIVLVEA